MLISTKSYRNMNLKKVSFEEGLELDLSPNPDEEVTMKLLHFMPPRQDEICFVAIFCDSIWEGSFDHKADLLFLRRGTFRRGQSA